MMTNRAILSMCVFRSKSQQTYSQVNVLTMILHSWIKGQVSGVLELVATVNMKTFNPTHITIGFIIH